MADPKNQTSSDEIIDSLFASITKGENIVSEKTFNSILTEKINSDSSTTKDADGRNSTENGPSTSDSIPISVENSKFSSNAIKTVKKESKPVAIKISLKETTKTKIIESNATKLVPKCSTLGEEGEILPSDIEELDDDSKSVVNEFDVIDETDGELSASDRDEKSSLKKRTKKKKHEKHKRKKDKEKKKKKSKDRRRKESTEKTIVPDRPKIDRQPANQDRFENYSSRPEKSTDRESLSRREKSSTEYFSRPDRNSRIERSAEPGRRDDSYQSDRSRGQDQRPWSKMIHFQLNRNRPDYSNRSRGNLSRQRDWAESHPSARSGSQSRSFRSVSGNYSERRKSHSPESLEKRDTGSTSASTVPFRASKQWSLAQDRQQRIQRKRSRSRSRQRSPSREKVPRLESDAPTTSVQKSAVKENGDDEGPLDKKKLYEIARRNAAELLQSGALQEQLKSMSTADLMKLRSGTKSVEELIAHCRKLQKREKREKRDDAESSSDEGEAKNDGEDNLDAFVRHPFLLKQQTNSFTFNVKNMIQIPIKTPAERAADDAKLRITFPVSSGEQHRNTDGAWVPVSPPPSGKSTEKTKGSKSSSTLAIEGSAPMLALPPPPSPPVLSFMGPLPPPPPPPALQPMEEEPVDIGEVVNNRLKAIQRLNDNANDMEAMKLLHFAEQQLKKWTDSKNIPGLFCGSTGVDVMPAEQLAPSDIRFHAWAKKDMLTTAKPVTSGLGMQLLQKMGWRPGEGLGKNREGALEPLLLEIKQDRKGLLASEEGPNQRIRSSAPNMKDFQGKHPVSALMELCAKRRWGPPSFSCNECGPAHDRQFTWKVMVNGVEYQTATPTNNKKAAKAQVCQVVLQSLGLLPRDASLPVVIG